MSAPKVVSDTPRSRLIVQPDPSNPAPRCCGKAMKDYDSMFGRDYWSCSKCGGHAQTMTQRTYDTPTGS